MTVDIVELADRAGQTARDVQHFLVSNGILRVDIAGQALRVLIDVEIEIEAAIEDYPDVEILRRIHTGVHGYTLYLFELLECNRILAGYERTEKMPGETEH
ncbi:hypothetical protein SBC1_31440 [Caballeronia sp. SBC1]|uniref:hypothetical protein n=1 Tax=Caballeronia sp. SBC1 TaxID=2705548 RepID=UPI00140C84ED|nr:hypothetical protein [Caballeronia sp. SBC1]QIN63120.1 hypothetical protein SBC1_31440 [Caballeronia sp. SBC1]